MKWQHLEVNKKTWMIHSRRVLLCHPRPVVKVVNRASRKGYLRDCVQKCWWGLQFVLGCWMVTRFGDWATWARLERSKSGPLSSIVGFICPQGHVEYTGASVAQFNKELFSQSRCVCDLGFFIFHRAERTLKRRSRVEMKHSVLLFIKVMFFCRVDFHILFLIWR